MSKLTKKQKTQVGKIDSNKLYPLSDALGLVKEFANAKFDESIDVAVQLGIDAKKSDQVVRGAVVLPNGTGKTKRVAVFVEGCFWHGCRWQCRRPKTRADYWEAKISRNKARDKEVRRLLLAKGWKVCRIWEHALANPDKVAEKLNCALLGSSCKK